MQTVSKGERLIIGLFGRRNAGKSSLINAIMQQEISIVSDMPGTTTDPVARSYELLPLGPVTLYDTAGIDDTDDLGLLRIRASRKILWRSDIILVVIDEVGLTNFDKNLIEEVIQMKVTCLVIFNKSDIKLPSLPDLDFCIERKIPTIAVSAKNHSHINELKELIIQSSPKELSAEQVLVADLIKEGDVVLLVIPIDLAAPKGRLILPQVQVLRDILDSNAVGMIVKEKEIQQAFDCLQQKPALVVTDSQVILKVSGDVPDDVPLTTFSTLFARYKGDLNIMVEGANAIDQIAEGSKILIAEACSHHVQSDDIGRIKIPRWITNYTGKDFIFEIKAGHDFPENLEDYSLVVQCGSCMITHMEVMRRIRECVRRKVPVTNYGVLISKLHGVLDRVIQPFQKDRSNW